MTYNDLLNTLGMLRLILLKLGIMSHFTKRIV